MKWLGTPEISHLKNKENVVEVYEKMFKIHSSNERLVSFKFKKQLQLNNEKTAL